MVGKKFYCGVPGEFCNTSGQCSKDEGICKRFTGFNGDFDYGICPRVYSEDCKKPDEPNNNGNDNGNLVVVFLSR